MKSVQRLIAIVAIGVFGVGGIASAADVKPTTISIPKMHCAGCAKKVCEQLKLVPGVAKLETDMATKTIKVTPRPNATPSPKALWEAVEEGDQEPTKIQGPSGTFTEKPKK